VKKGRAKVETGEMQSEYDFSGGVRGKYASRFAKGSALVLLEPDVAQMFPDARSVNDALRALASIIRARLRKKPDRRPVR
jgi:hypothetical protein